MEKLLLSTKIGDQESEIVKRPSPECRKMHDRKAGESQDVSCRRFFSRTINSQNESTDINDVTEEENDDCVNLEKFIATNFKVCRNACAIRVRKIVKRHLDTERFGVIQFSLENRKNPLQGLTTSGLDRSSDAFKMVKPSLHCVALSRENKAMFEFGQCKNVDKHAKEKELQELNGFFKR